MLMKNFNISIDDLENKKKILYSKCIIPVHLVNSLIWRLYKIVNYDIKIIEDSVMLLEVNINSKVKRFVVRLITRFVFFLFMQ